MYEGGLRFAMYRKVQNMQHVGKRVKEHNDIRLASPESVVVDVSAYLPGAKLV